MIVFGVAAKHNKIRARYYLALILSITQAIHLPILAVAQ